MNKIPVTLLALVVSGSTEGAEIYPNYTADFVRVVDGDTIELNVRVWPGQINRVHLRLDGINTPEASS